MPFVRAAPWASSVKGLDRFLVEIIAGAVAIPYQH
jgi:hypothetical protein